MWDQQPAGTEKPICPEIYFVYYTQKTFPKDVNSLPDGFVIHMVGVEEEEENEKNFFGRLCDAINSNDPHSAVEDDAATREIHDAAEVFDERTEGVFRYLQVRSQTTPSD